MKYNLIAKTLFLTTNDGSGHLAAEEVLNVEQYQIHRLMDICDLKVETWCRFLISILQARKEYRYSKIPQVRQLQLPSLLLSNLLLVMFTTVRCCQIIK
jgi:hypothetical protein